MCIAHEARRWGVLSKRQRDRWYRSRSAELAMSGFDGRIVGRRCGYNNRAFLVSLLLASLSIVRDLSSPGRKVSLQLTFTLVPFLILALLSYDGVTSRHLGGLQYELVHQSVVACLVHVGLLAVPAFVILVFTVKAFAPVDLSRAGLYIGVLSGCIGALGYAFHCHDEFITLVAVSYNLAIVQMGLIGALLGPRLLRWA